MTEEEKIKKQKEDDDSLIPRPGMNRSIKQIGRINFQGGKVKEVEITFKRTRNQQGGVDVVAIMPEALATLAKEAQPGG